MEVSLTTIVNSDSPNPPASQASPQSMTGPPEVTNGSDPAQIQAQQEYLRTLFKQPLAADEQSGQPGQQGAAEDPMMKMLQQMMGGAGDDANDEGGLPFSSEELSKVTGVPSFLTDMLMGKQKAPPTIVEMKSARIWKIIHTTFALIASIYTVYVLRRSVGFFGAKPPAPPTVQNPFLLFIMGESIIQGTKLTTAGAAAKRGLSLGLQILRDLAADGCLVVFVMGIWQWWNEL